LSEVVSVNGLFPLPMGVITVSKSGLEADFKPDLLKFENRLKTGFGN